MAPILMAFGYELPVAYVVFVPGLLRPGQSRITTPRKETDTCRILSGLYEGMTTGTSICVFVPNTDQRGHDYSEMSIAYRPSHADATYDFKYGLRAIQGGGRSSARETIGRVAAGALAKKILKMYAGTEGLGCPVFDKLEADLAKAMLSLPATKGFEFGSGFAGERGKGQNPIRGRRVGAVESGGIPRKTKEELPLLIGGGAARIRISSGGVGPVWLGGTEVLLETGWEAGSCLVAAIGG
ncbi:Chorismate synthase [Musa troglodytarum]|uniref:chorismate synthase n=1 Tax=Musa troglodytarum TaxID=320322 RepID=A0A9E7JEB7_9LILI|nr:Chorismate synthase [Musa troglodytarum]